jgi:hypothetical protein
MTATDTPETRQDRPQTTMVKSMSMHAYTITDEGTGDTARINIIQRYRPVGATIEAFDAKLSWHQADKYGVLASATLTMQEGDSINSYTQRIYEQAAILGMDTLRELARPLLRDVPTAGES